MTQWSTWRKTTPTPNPFRCQAHNISIQVKSISLHSCTPTEFFFRCSVEFPQVQAGFPSLRVFNSLRRWLSNQKFSPSSVVLPPFRGQVGETKKSTTRVWWGQAFDLDEDYEFCENFSLMGVSKGFDPSVNNPKASTLNTLVTMGRTKRATRTSTTDGDWVGARTIPLSVLGNGDPKQFVFMERGLIGHRAPRSCHQGKFLVITDTSVARAPMPAGP